MALQLTLIDVALIEVIRPWNVHIVQASDLVIISSLTICCELFPFNLHYGGPENAEEA